MDDVTKKSESLSKANKTYKETPKGMSIEEGHYLDDTQRLGVGERRNEISELFRESTLDISLLDSSDWIRDVAMNLAVMNVYVDEALSLEVPLSFRKSGAHLKEAMKHYKNAINVLPEALDNNEKDQVLEAGESFDAAEVKMKDAAQAIKNMQ